jgi:hypothetical protein
MTAAGQRRLLVSIGEAGGPVTLAALRGRHPDLAADVGRGVVRLAMMGLAAMRRDDDTLSVALAPAGARLLGGPVRCLRCGLTAAWPDPGCDDGADHYVGRAAGCPCCGRLLLACARRPCSAMSGPE